MDKKVKSALASLCAACVVLFVFLANGDGRAQDAREALGPKDDAAAAAWKRGPHPLTRLMATAHSKLRPEFKGRHPRVYVTAEGLEQLRRRARTTHHNTVLIDGRGQAREGKGHDAFDDVPYERLDAIRITEARLSRRSAYLRADLTSAYEPDLGLRRFVREFRFDGRDEFVISDTVRAGKPVLSTWLLHADNRVGRAGDRGFVIAEGGARLLIDVAEPSGARASVEPNELTAPGRPGSVDKGERQVRGERLAVSTREPTTDAKFVVRLKVLSP